MPRGHEDTEQTTSGNANPDAGTEEMPGPPKI